ncbi:hypothetical protein ABZ260_04060 [Streptosporangium sp. NPDC006013]|uniref:hypothetical protein n=1 Tax=Streptosporangium sp. NPDC006013 TaxID=3155596 RepID=UPI00339F7CC2
MASDDLLGTVWELMWVVRPSGTHLSRSSTPGGSNPLVRDDDNTLVAQAVLFPADKAIKAGAAVCVLVGIVVGIVATKATPHVKNRFNDIKSKLNLKSEGSVEAAAQEARPEQSDLGVEEPRSGNRRLSAA